MKKEQLIIKARNLRTKGHSLREISELLRISKSTASLWLKEEKISKAGQARLNKIRETAIERSKALKLAQKIDYLQKIAQNCRVLEKKKSFCQKDMKMFLALLFWCEGSKKDRRLVFMNSDAELIKTYLSLLRKAYKIEEERLRATLHLHDYHKREQEIDYWSKVTQIKKHNIGVYDKKNSGTRKKEGYRGCISIRYGDVRILDELLLIIKRFTTNKF